MEKIERKIKRALVSVYHKEGLEEIIRALHALDVELVSTGGTKDYIESLGIPATAVEDLTQYPSMLGGRVKTLHPGVFGGILARREHEQDLKEVAEFNIRLFDLVIVDLYPFADTVASGASQEDIIEKIDIGGISLIRGAAKNFQDVLIISSVHQYLSLLDILREQKGITSLEERKHFAKLAFAVSSGYDTDIFRYFDQGNLSAFRVAEDHLNVLRYGENPHQKGYFFGNLELYFDKLQGKEISYNNLQDIAAACDLIAEYKAPTFAVLKHNNPCGIATRETIQEAWVAALACDPESAFGGILVANRPIDVATAQSIGDLFFEVLIAPDYDSEALAILTQKNKRILLLQKGEIPSNYSFKSALGGVLVQEDDNYNEDPKAFEVVTQKSPSEDEVDDFVFAQKVVKHCKSNAIALAKDSCLLAVGIGQTSRVSALKQAIEKARNFGFDLQGAVLASDAFFPFDDCVALAAEAGITAIVQPGGSLRDKDSIKKADELGIAMVMTGVRHFKH
ncbi:bifunctional phosphoribosylaminoimidazolecarboxamide formyltransferase/IMP cyclohydrolase [Porphyromonas gingivicanis]|uniref:bifunctional phosphoribosylaminoimidazolecarboxamide formyltransferase/IMP cyclohydrolase n=1 Tax=Porphyromonas gingivicanis TaxID=266762 RepID=UPI0004703ACB|nr:bifunctional phosphoribosylaminoimidazolecarboxamide formyltransferase/IMP cyclohydrolase [Porphyromonas gingivicanis]